MFALILGFLNLFSSLYFITLTGLRHRTSDTLIPETSLFIGFSLHANIRCRRKSAPDSDLLSILVEEERNACKQGSYATYETPSTSNTQCGEHLVGEKRCGSAAGRTGNGVCGNGRGSILQITIHKVVQICDKDEKQGAREKTASESGNDPVHIASRKSVTTHYLKSGRSLILSRPCKPEHGCGKANATNHR